MTAPGKDEAVGRFEGRRIALVGKLAGMSKREAAQLLRRHGAVVVERPGPEVHLVVVGEGDWPLAVGTGPEELFDEATRQAVEEGSVEVISETQLWQGLGLADLPHDIHRLYTPAMLAELLGVPIAVIRRWHRRGLIVPAREVRRLPYFDFQEVATARRLAQLLAAGMSPAAIEKKLEALARYVPGASRPLAQLSVIIQGRQILLRQGDGLIEPGGQLRLDFETPTPARGPGARPVIPPRVLRAVGPPEQQAVPASAEELASTAAALEEQGDLEAAAQMYRAAMAAGGPTAEWCFQLAELLYRLGDLAGARERYFTAIELDEDFVEARANLGCVLAQSGQSELAVAALQGALAYHPDYADAHYHLARVLDGLGRWEEAERHWRAFLELAPDSPWSQQARNRLGGTP
ncbi:MAG: tetratricopeptide repeat protein [Thermoguttaceae bacterium]